MTPSPFLPTGSQCHNGSFPPPPTPHAETPPPLTLPTRPGGSSCGSWGGVRVWPVPTSLSAAPGAALSLECRFEPEDANVTWLQVCPRGRAGGCRWPEELPALGGGRQVRGGGSGVSRLSFEPLERNHSGLYLCRVSSRNASAQSCGTFVRVLEPVPVPFLDLADATKNRILTAQGVLLLLCAAGPGLLLLFRVRRGLRGTPAPNSGSAGPDPGPGVPDPGPAVPNPCPAVPDVSVLTTPIPPGSPKSPSRSPEIPPATLNSPLKTPSFPFNSSQ
uniref:Ig-like domain-containing protein n=1 Tax=Taeniopygia guttata TaxID=59729 RepID=A0A674HJE5_TAEGU